MAWKHLFGKAADNLERSMENEDECEILLTFPSLLEIVDNFSINFRYDSREFSCNEYIRICSRRYGPVELRRICGWHYSWNVGQCPFCKYLSIFHRFLLKHLLIVTDILSSQKSQRTLSRGKMELIAQFSSLSFRLR